VAKEVDVRFGTLLLIGGFIALVTLLTLYAYARLVPLKSPFDLVAQPGLVVVDSKGNVLQRDMSDGLRVPVKLQDVSPAMIDATIAAEDARFRSHPGVDPIAVVRSVVSLPFRRSGASTLTQQIARRLYLQNGVGMPVVERKAREALIALQLEARYSKDDILELYLNQVYYGRGAYGVEAASRVYFGVSARNLDYAQAALLAGLPQLPGIYGAAPDAQAAGERRGYVIGRLMAT
jgi:penicillin-binding protein 1A